MNQKAHIDDLVISDLNVRKLQEDDEERAEIRRLANNIQQTGLLSPPIVRPSKKHSGKLEVIAGQRRTLAIRKLAREAESEEVRERWSHLEVDFRDVDDAEALQISFVENDQRKDIDIFERAEAIKNLLEQLNVTQRELAKRIGYSEQMVAEMLSVLKLGPELREMVNDKRLSRWQAVSLAQGYQDDYERQEFVAQIIEGRTTVESKRIFKVIRENPGWWSLNRADMKTRILEAISIPRELREELKRMRKSLGMDPDGPDYHRMTKEEAEEALAGYYAMMRRREEHIKAGEIEVKRTKKPKKENPEEGFFELDSYAPEMYGQSDSRTRAPAPKTVKIDEAVLEDASELTAEFLDNLKKVVVVFHTKNPDDRRKTVPVEVELKELLGTGHTYLNFLEAAREAVLQRKTELLQH